MPAMKRISKKEEMALIKRLEDNAALLTPKNLQDRSRLGSRWAKRKSEITAALQNDIVLVNRLLAQCVRDLVSCGITQSAPDNHGVSRIITDIDRVKKTSDHEQKFSAGVVHLQDMSDKIANIGFSPSDSELSETLTKTAQALRQVASYNHVMTAKEFQAATNVPNQKRPANMKQIDYILAQLEEPAPSRFSSIWKKKPVQWTDDNARLKRIEEVKKTIVEPEIKAIDDAAKKSGGSKPADDIRRAGLEKLLMQLDYQITRRTPAPHVSPNFKPR